MGYRRAVLLRWSRRDRLAVLVIAVTAGFLVGATLMGLAIGAQAGSLAGSYGSDAGVTYYSSAETAAADAGEDDAVLPVTSVAVGDRGDRAQRPAIGVPRPGPTVTVGDREMSLPAPPEGTLLVEGAAGQAERAVTGPSGERRLTIRPRGGQSPVPGSWYVASASTVERLGPTGAFVLSGDGSAATPLVAALWFFVLGTRQLVELLAVLTAASGVLVLVTVYGVTRIAVEDRRETVGVIRATGATPARVLSLFGARALGLSVVGVLVGYGLGLILVRVAINAAVFAGVPTSLDVRLTARAARLLVPAGVCLAAAGGVAGALAALPAVRRSPAAVTRPSVPSPAPEARSPIRRLRATADTRLLDWSALVPTAATLSVFVAFLLLAAAVGGVLAPLTAADEQTITQPGARHPFASTVPAVYADALRDRGISASPEILLLEANDGTPFLARGVDYDAYRDLSSARLVEGRAPSSPSEAVVGADLARSLSVDVGDTITLGGLTRPGFHRVEIVGRFAAPGSEDDQLLVSLPVARELTGKGPDAVQFVRTSRFDVAANGSTVFVVDARATAVEEGTRVALDLRNYGLEDREASIDVRVSGYDRTVRVEVPAGGRTTVETTVPRLDPGTHRLRAGEFDRNVTVGDDGRPGEFRVSGPDRAPTGEAPRLVVTEAGSPRPNATVTVESPDGERRSLRTDADGEIRVELPSPGEYRVTARAGERTDRATVVAGAGYDRAFAADLRISPAAPSVVTRPRAAATLSNPWNDTVTRSVALVGPDARFERTVTLGTGESTTIETRLGHRPAGRYGVALRQDGRETDAVEYEVRGDERLAAALASSGRRESGGGVAQAADVAFGNVKVLLIGLVALSAVMTVGGTTASFTRSIRAGREEIGVRRATGATPGAIVRLVLGDALRIGLVAVALALGVATTGLSVLLSAGRLRLFGVALRPTFSPELLLAAAGAALALALVSATVAAANLVRRPPAELLSEDVVAAPIRSARSGSSDGRPGSADGATSDDARRDAEIDPDRGGRS